VRRSWPLSRQEPSGAAQRTRAVHPSDHQRQADRQSWLRSTDGPLDLSGLSLTHANQLDDQHHATKVFLTGSRAGAAPSLRESLSHSGDTRVVKVGGQHWAASASPPLGDPGGVQPDSRPGEFGFRFDDTAIGVPVNYVGVPSFPGGSSAAAHLAIEAGRTRFAGWDCPEAKPAGVELRGVRVGVFKCPPGSDSDLSGHLLFRWSQQGVTYVVSLHGWTAVNQSVLMSLTSNVLLVGATSR
jgi:hypothetical protein